MTQFFTNDVLISDEESNKIEAKINLKSTESEEDEYVNLKPYSNCISTDNLHNFSGNKKNEKIFYICIFFKRNKLKFVVEIWKFSVNMNGINTAGGNFRKTFLYKKLSVMIRTLISLLKLLPVYTLFTSQVLNFDLDFEIENKSVAFFEKENGCSFSKMLFNNYADNIGSLKLEVYYLNKNDIFNTEQELNKKLINEEVTIKRQRFLSDNVVDILQLNNFDELSLKRNNSKSLEDNLLYEHCNHRTPSKELNYKSTLPINFQTKSGTTRASSNFTYNNNAPVVDNVHNFSELLNNEDIEHKENKLKEIEFKYRNLEIEREEDNQDYISISDESFLNVSIEGENSDFELKVFEDLKDEQMVESINKSYIDHINTDKVELDKIIHVYGKLKNEINSNYTSLNLFNFISKIYTKKLT